MHDQVLRERLIEHSLAGRFSGFVRTGLLLALVGGVLFAVVAAGQGAVRGWQAFHVNWLFFTGLAAGSLAVTAVHKIANAKWSGLILRFSQAAVAFLPVSLVGLVLIFTVGYHAIYGPMVERLPELGAGKAAWLSHGFMFPRLLAVLAIFLGLGWSLIHADMLPDMFMAKDRASGWRRQRYEAWTAGFDGSQQARDRQHARIHRLAAIFAPVYALGATVIAFDMIMALQPHWTSNLLGGFYFMGSFLGANMLLALTMLYGERQTGIHDLISPKQRHDLGKLCFGFTVFWAYLMWSQYLVIWYGNMPEETGFVFSRLWGPWRPVGTAVFLGMFLIPFAGLLGVAPKKNRQTLALFAGISLVALWLERYLLVIPSVTSEHAPPFGLPEAAPTVMFLGLFLLCYGLFARTYPMVSPRLAEITLDRETHHGHVPSTFEHEEGPEDYVTEATVERDKHTH